jgi:hypothetical protein
VDLLRQEATEAKVKVGQLRYAFRKSQRKHDVELTEQRGETSRLKDSLGKNVRKMNSLFSSVNGLRTTHPATIARNDEKQKVRPVLISLFVSLLIRLFVLGAACENGKGYRFAENGKS